MCPMTTVGSGTEFYGKQCFLSTSNIAPLPPKKKKQTKGNTIKTNKQIKQTKQTTPPTTTTKKTYFPSQYQTLPCITEELQQSAKSQGARTCPVFENDRQIHSCLK